MCSELLLRPGRRSSSSTAQGRPHGPGQAVAAMYLRGTNGGLLLVMLSQWMSHDRHVAEVLLWDTLMV